MEKKLALIGVDDSKKIIVKGVTEVTKENVIKGCCVLGHADEGYYHIKKQDKHNNFEIVSKKKWRMYHEVKEAEKCDILEVNSITHHVTYIGDGKFVIDEKIALWDNNITGLNCLEHLLGGTVVRPTQKATYFQLQRPESYNPTF